MIHGGDIYRNEVTLDFSINVNPLGIPSSVKQALKQAIQNCDRYPDVKAEKLHQALSHSLNIPQSHLVCGNGASELFLAIVHAVQCKTALLPAPSFYGYQHAMQAMAGTIIHYPLKEQDQFQLTDQILSYLSPKIDILFLTNPNNPLGNCISKELLIQILKQCEQYGIIVVLDECFLEFVMQEEAYTMLHDYQAYPHLLVVRAFTKLYAIPGVRLGYLYSANMELLSQIRKQLPEWNLSTFAQQAGIQALKEVEYVARTKQVVAKERSYLTKRLTYAGMRVYPSETNFILFHSSTPLYEPLLQRKILIRDCSNFHGLGEGYYRIAVKRHHENKQLMDAIETIIKEQVK